MDWYYCYYYYYYYCYYPYITVQRHLNNIEGCSHTMKLVTKNAELLQHGFIIRILNKSCYYTVSWKN